MTHRLTGKTIAIVVAQEFEDIELLYPILRLSEEGATILVSAVRMGLHPRPYMENKPVTGRFGHPVPIPIMQEGRRYQMREIETLRAEELDGLIIPGGFSPDYLRRHPGTLELVLQCHQRGKIIATICHGPWVLISAGIVRGRQATGLIAVRDDLINAGAEYLDEPVVRDDNLIFSRRPDDLPEFCAAIIQALSQ
jgi:protease I